MKAYLKNYRQSPRKVRLVADFVRGKNLGDAIAEMKFMNKRAASAIEKLLKSAAANAKDTTGAKENELFIKNITVNEGFALKRWMSRAFGRATPFKKRTSHISIVLDKREQQKNKAPNSKPLSGRQEVKKEEKKS